MPWININLNESKNGIDWDARARLVVGLGMMSGQTLRDCLKYCGENEELKKRVEKIWLSMLDKISKDNGG